MKEMRRGAAILSLFSSLLLVVPAVLSAPEAPVPLPPPKAKVERAKEDRPAPPDVRSSSRPSDERRTAPTDRGNEDRQGPMSFDPRQNNAPRVDLKQKEIANRENERAKLIQTETVSKAQDQAKRSAAYQSNLDKRAMRNTGADGPSERSAVDQQGKDLKTGGKEGQLKQSAAEEKKAPASTFTLENARSRSTTGNINDKVGFQGLGGGSENGTGSRRGAAENELAGRGSEVGSDKLRVDRVAAETDKGRASADSFSLKNARGRSQTTSGKESDQQRVADADQQKKAAEDADLQRTSKVASSEKQTKAGAQEQDQKKKSAQADAEQRNKGDADRQQAAQQEEMKRVADADQQKRAVADAQSQKAKAGAEERDQKKQSAQADAEQRNKSDADRRRAAQQDETKRVADADQQKKAAEDAESQKAGKVASSEKQARTAAEEQDQKKKMAAQADAEQRNKSDADRRRAAQQDETKRVADADQQKKAAEDAESQKAGKVASSEKQAKAEAQDEEKKNGQGAVQDDALRIRDEQSDSRKGHGLGTSVLGSGESAGQKPSQGSILGEGTSLDPRSKNSVEQGSVPVLSNGFYEVNGVKFSERYYQRLWNTGRGSPSLVANEILSTGVKGVPDATKAGFLRYETAGWEMVYNPETKEVWHLQPNKK